MPSKCATCKGNQFTTADCGERHHHHLLCHGVVREGSLVSVPLLLELHVAEQQGGGDNPPDGDHVLVSDTHHLKIMN